MRILKKRAQAEIEVRKSRFIAVALPIEDLGQIKALVSQFRSEHPGAAHVVHAAVAGPDGQQHSYSDDKEPRNTAGRPALEVLKGSGITNIVVLIVRYFGGTLLGTGGLVKAYGDSVKEVLNHVVTEELIDKTSFVTTIPYNLYDLVKIELTKVEAAIIDEQFTTDITIEGMLPTHHLPQLEEAISNLSQGSTSLIVIDE